MDLKILHPAELVYGIDIKEQSSSSKKKLHASLDKYGQLYPVLVYRSDDQWHIAKGNNVVRALRERDAQSVYCIEIDVNDSFDVLAVKRAFVGSADDINVLKLAIVLTELNKEHDVNTISERTGMDIENIINLCDLLKLNNLLKSREEEKQPKLF